MEIVRYKKFMYTNCSDTKWETPRIIQTMVLAYIFKTKNAGEIAKN